MDQLGYARVYESSTGLHWVQGIASCDVSNYVDSFARSIVERLNFLLGSPHFPLSLIVHRSLLLKLTTNPPPKMIEGLVAAQPTMRTNANERSRLAYEGKSLQ